MRKLAETPCLNNKQIISDISRNLDMSEITSFSINNSINKIINNIRNKQ